MPDTAPRRAWALSLLRTVLAMASYAAGAGLRVFPQWGLELYVAVGTLCGMFTLAVEYCTSVRPTRHWHEKVPTIIDEFIRSTEFLEKLSVEAAVTLHLRIMTPKRTWRWLGLRRYLTVWWWTQDREGRPDVGMICPVGQGVPGVCFRKNDAVFSGPSLSMHRMRRLPRPLHFFTEELKLQASIAVPIREVERNGRESGKVVGVLVLDSITVDAIAVLTSEEIRPIVKGGMHGIARFVGHILS